MLHKKSAFTLAEALLTLGLLGVVAMMTVPAIVANYQDHMFEASSKAVSLELINGFKMLEATDGKMNKLQPTPSVNGGNTDTIDRYVVDRDGRRTKDDTPYATFAEAYAFEKLTSSMKVGRVCASGAFQNFGGSTKSNPVCGFYSEGSSTPYISMENQDGETKDVYILTNDGHINFSGNQDGGAGANNNNISQAFQAFNQAVAGMVLANGASAIVMYNPYCRNRVGNEAIGLQHVCADIIYDTNGSEAPNQFGKDIGIVTAFYRTNSRYAAPKIYKDVIDFSTTNGGAPCKTASVAGNKTTSRPSPEELAAINIHKDLLFTSNSSMNNTDILDGTSTNQTLCLYR